MYLIVLDMWVWDWHGSVAPKQYVFTMYLILNKRRIGEYSQIAIATCNIHQYLLQTLY